MRRNQQQSASRTKDAEKFLERGAGISRVLEGDNIYRSIEAGVGKRKSGEIRDGMESAVIPLRVANPQVDSNVALPIKPAGILSFARPRIEDKCIRIESGREPAHSIFDRQFEMEDLTPERSGKTSCETSRVHVRERASTITDAPWPKKASANANGNAAATSAR